MTRLQLPCVPRPGPIPWSMLATCLLLLNAAPASASATNQPAAPTIQSETVSNIEPDAPSATLETQIATNGLQTEYQLWIKCGIALFECGSAELVAGGTIPAATPSQDVSANVDGVTHGDAYEYWVLATNPDGTTTGETLTFWPDKAWPGLGSETEDARGITEDEASVEGIVYPGGTETWSFTYFFEYGPTASYGASAPEQPGLTVNIGSCTLCKGGGADPRTAGVTFTGLTPATTYHYRFVVTSSKGYRQFGQDATFTTLPARPIETPSTNSSSGSPSQTNTPTLLPTAPPFSPPSTRPPAPPSVHTPHRSKTAKLLARAVKACNRKRTHRHACLRRAHKVIS